MSKYTASQVLSTSGRGREARWSGADRWWRTSRRVSPSRPVVGPHRDHVGGVVGLARREPHLPRRQGLGPTDDGGVRAGALGQPLDEVLVVPAPRHVNGPHLPVPEAEARRPRRHEEGGVVAGAAAPPGAQPGAVGHGVTLRGALPHPSAGEVEHLVSAGRYRQQGA